MRRLLRRIGQVEMAGPRHLHPPAWTGEIRCRIEDGDRLYVDRADELVIISDVLIEQFRAGESPFVTVTDPDVAIYGQPMFTITITAGNGVFAYRGSQISCGCMVATRQAH